MDEVLKSLTIGAVGGHLSFVFHFFHLVIPCKRLGRWELVMPALERTELMVHP